jgi:hypothetical protein
MSKFNERSFRKGISKLTQKERLDMLCHAARFHRDEQLRAEALAVEVNALRAQSTRSEVVRSEVVRCKAVAASAYQVLNLALQEPKDSAMTAHLVHCATVALGTIED